MQLRQKGGSLGLIRELLATVGVAVGTDTIARFIAEVNGDRALHRTPRWPGRQRAAAPRTAQPPNAADTPVVTPIPPSDHRLKHPPTQRQPTRRRSVYASAAHALPMLATSEHARLPWPNKSISSSTAKAESARASSTRISPSISKIAASTAKERASFGKI